MKDYSAYTDVHVGKDLTVFHFTSSGPNGDVHKVVQFYPSGKRGYYILGFGDWEDGGFDDKVITNNGDRNKVLATVAMAIFAFLERYPGRKVIFQGSTPARTRLYRMAITIGWDVLSQFLTVQALKRKANGRLKIVPFEHGGDYEAFILKRKHPRELPNPPPAK